MLIDWCCEQDRIRKKADGGKDEYEKYQNLKSIEPEIDEQYKQGLINEERYRSYKEKLASIEKQMEG